MSFLNTLRKKNILESLQNQCPTNGKREQFLLDANPFSIIAFC
nr:MAG TPA: hypothetical protein [Caudoviricetes sp.]